MPHFGEFKRERKELIAENKKNSDLLANELMPQEVRPGVVPKKEIPKVQVSVAMQRDIIEDELINPNGQMKRTKTRCETNQAGTHIELIYEYPLSARG